MKEQYRNGPTPEYIESVHKLREDFLYAIQLGDRSRAIPMELHDLFR
jgi:hypothetical protein